MYNNWTGLCMCLDAQITYLDAQITYLDAQITYINQLSIIHHTNSIYSKWLTETEELVL